VGRGKAASGTRVGVTPDCPPTSTSRLANGAARAAQNKVLLLPLADFEVHTK
jgi:hypothetical protein